MNPVPYSKTMIVWWRFGKEHGDDEFRVNPPEVINAHIQRKIDRFRKTPADEWRWYQVDPDLIVERYDTSPEESGPDTRIYYLLNCGLAVIENIHLPPPEDNWKWLIRIADFFYNKEMESWIMKDLFCDICVENDCHTYHMFDLPDLAQALDIHLITRGEARDILKRVDWFLNRVSRRQKPLPEILRGQETCKRLGW